MTDFCANAPGAVACGGEGRGHAGMRQGGSVWSAQGWIGLEHPGVAEDGAATGGVWGALCDNARILRVIHRWRVSACHNAIKGLRCV